MGALAWLYQESQHVDNIGLHGQSDLAVWRYAEGNDFVIVSKDDDFRQFSGLHGAPPKVIWLAEGTATQTIATLVGKDSMALDAFRSSPEESLLILA